MRIIDVAIYIYMYIYIYIYIYVYIYGGLVTQSALVSERNSVY